MDLYAILGVARDATTAAIRRAFRKKAKTMHPDVGGSVDAFQQLQRAYNTLVDEELRRTYDETGRVGEKKPADMDPIYQRAATSVAGMILEVMTLAEEGPIYEDPIPRCVKAVKKEEERILAAKKKLEKSIASGEKFLKRWHHKKTLPINLVAHVIEASLQNMRAALANAEEDLKVIAESIRIVEDYTFDLDQRPERNDMAAMYNDPQMQRLLREWR